MEAINWTVRTERKIEAERDGRWKATLNERRKEGEITVQKSCGK